MLYLDSSVLVKRYVQEAGSKAVATRFDRGETIYTSMLSFAEVHAAIGRKYRDKELSVNEKEKLVDAFVNDWLFSLSILELNTHTMSAIPTLCEQCQRCHSPFRRFLAERYHSASRQTLRR
jgi:predicted nucleic acid-binding protein